MGRENEVIAALKSAELDKSMFCVENDPTATALIGCLNQCGQFTGKASELVGKLSLHDPELKVSAKSLGKRLNALWPHLEKVLAVAKQEKDRKGFTIFTLKANTAEFAEFDPPILPKVPIHTREDTLSKTAL
jgi:hypothetical protein